MKWLILRLGLDKPSVLTAVVSIVGGGGVLLAFRQLAPASDDPEPFWWVFRGVITASAALFGYGVLTFVILLYRVGAFAWAFGGQLRFRNPFFLAPETTHQRPMRDGSFGQPSEPDEFTATVPLEPLDLGDIEPDAPMPGNRRAPAADLRLDLESHRDFILIKVRNDGPGGIVRGEITRISSDHFHGQAERTDWPWLMVFHRTGVIDEYIAPASSADIHLVDFDERGATRQLSSQGGAAFNFPGPNAEARGIFGRLGATTLDELKDERVNVTVRIYFPEAAARSVEREVCFAYQNTAWWCDELST